MIRDSMVAGWASAAAVAGCSATQLRRLVDRGGVVATKGPDGVWMFDRAELERVCGESQVAAAAPSVDPGAVVGDRPAATRGSSVTARAFELLNDGVSVDRLVIELGIEPEEAIRQFERWRAVKAADRDREQLVAAIDLSKRLDAIGWTAEQVIVAYGEVAQIRTALGDGGFTEDDAMQLLSGVRELYGDVGDGLAALERLQDAEDVEARADEAERRLDAMIAMEAPVRARVTALQEQVRQLMGFTAWLRLAKALHDVATAPDARVAPLRLALLGAAQAGPDVADAMLKAAGDSDAQARRQLAAWAASVLRDLVVPRGEHEAAVAGARGSGRIEGYAVAVLT